MCTYTAKTTDQHTANVRIYSPQHGISYDHEVTHFRLSRIPALVTASILGFTEAGCVIVGVEMPEGWQYAND